MTKFIDVIQLRHLAATIGAERLIVELAQYIRADYLRWHQFEKSARVAHHSRQGVIELMPISDGKLYSFKYVNGHPGNTAKGLLSVMGFGVLADVETGYPLLLSELTITTALRTAATSALAAAHLARKTSRSMAIIGNGAQSEFQCLAFWAMLGIREFRAYDVDTDATAKLIANLRHLPDLKISAANSIAEAVAGADIITTVTADKKRATILTPEMIEPGMHINAVGGDCPGKTELHPDILRGALVVVEFSPQTRIEGEIQQLPANHPVTELHDVLSGIVTGRAGEWDVTVFDSVGFALEDFSALRYLRDATAEQPLGKQVSLIPEPANAKDLYYLITSSAVSNEINGGHRSSKMAQTPRQPDATCTI